LVVSPRNDLPLPLPLGLRAPLLPFGRSPIINAQGLHAGEARAMSALTKGFRFFLL
jgi:hypothetical protein